MPCSKPLARPSAVASMFDVQKTSSSAPTRNNRLASLDDATQSSSRRARMKWTASKVFQCVALFLLASALEIGGCYGFWRAVRLEKNKLWAAFGAASLVAYGGVFLLMPMDAFARIMAAYGGVFIVSSYAFGAAVEGFKLDAGDYVGASIALAGVGVCLFWPRE